MKKITLSLVMITIAITVFAQAPQAFKYQAVARDNAGNVLVNQDVTFRFSILQGSASGTLIFSETHEAITNEFGLVNLKIGTGEPGIGFLIEIDWSTGEKFLEVELDPSGGYTFTSMGTTQLISVPYSLYSEATGDTTRWRKNNDDLYFTNGKVGIGAVLTTGSWANLLVKGNFMVDSGNAIIRHTDATESFFNLYNTVSDWELVAAADNNRFDIRKWGGVPALSISDNNYIGIGTTTPAGILDIAGAYHFPGIDGTSGQVLQTDGSGTLSWSSSGGSGVTEINDLTDAITIGHSIFLGSGAGLNDDGSYNDNVAVGHEAFNANTTGFFNTAFGYRSLYNNLTGTRNAATGYRSLFKNTTGASNTANGFMASHENTTGNYNTTYGYNADYYNKEGSRNTIIGYQAGMVTSLHNKSGNVFLGYRAGYNDTTDNKLYIENSNSSTPLIYGDFENDTLRINGTLDVNNAFHFPLSDGTAGQVLQTDGSGELNWITYAGGSVNEINDLSDGRTGGESVFLGSGAGANDDGTDNRNVAVGDSALNANISGDYNTANGYQALYSNTTGYHNTANGFKALYSNTTGIANTANGYQALYSNTYGKYNTANGFSALYSNTWGEYNTAIGIEALNLNTTGYFNTAIGHWALKYNTTGYGNTAIGFKANFFNEEGSNNTIIGYQAGTGTSLHNKSGNVFIGKMAGYYDTTDNKLYIENSGSWTPLIYGEFDNDLVRINGDLDVTGSFLGIGIDDLSDAKTGGSSVFLGSGAGVNDNGTNNRNVAVGDSSLYTNISGDYNTANGYSALYSNTTGTRNTANGYGALRNNTTGNYNTANGYGALFYNIEGVRNTAIGHKALNSNTTGYDNTANGYQALLFNTTGNHNTATGYFANLYNQEGSNNTIIGYEAGKGATLHNKSGNIFLGYQAGFNETGDNKLYIDNSDTIAPLIYGEFANDLVRINGNLDVTGSFLDIGIDDLSDGRTIGNSVFLGSGAGANDDGTDNRNVAVGREALMTNTSGVHNTANGFQALYSNTTGSRNTAIGYQALKNDTTGFRNTAIGYQTLLLNTAGYCNTANGHWALLQNTIGNNNTANGYNANFYNQEGSNNTIIGYEAGRGSTFHNKSGNIFLGYQAGYYDTTDNKLYIENSSISNPLIYGDFANDTVRINGDFQVTGDWVGLEINKLVDGKTGGNSVFLGSGAGANDDGTDNRNVAVGDSALYNIDGTGTYLWWDGTENTAIGSKALYTNTTGYWNTANGYKALYANLTGFGNTANAHSALHSNSTGYFNTANGFMALNTNTVGNYNTAIGATALNFNTEGNNNTAIGVAANYYNEEGSNNTIIGHEAGMGTSAHNKSGNVLLGYQAGFNETGDNKLYIDNSDTIAPLIYGEFANDLVRINGDLDVTGSFLDIGIDDLSDGRTIGNSVFLGSGAGANDDGSNNKNVAVGIDALNVNTTGYKNTANGFEALYSNIDGGYNTAIGNQALYLNTSGHTNTAIGNQALYVNLTGDFNTAIGDNALSYNSTGNNNTTTGYYSNYYNEEGSNNTIMGFEAGKGASSHNKSGNVILGYQAGYNTTNGSDDNVFLGYQAGYHETGANKLYIENSNSLSPLIYGEFDNDLLRVNGTLDINNAYQFPTADGINGQVLQTDGSSTLSWTNNEINDLTDGKTGGNSVFLGSGSGFNDNGTDNQNVAVGDSSLYTNTSGLYNTANGYQALFTNTTGSKNTAIGFKANYFNQEGSNNTIIGYGAGYGSSLHNKSGNVFLGYQAGLYETTDNKLYIENTYSDEPLIWGDFFQDKLKINGSMEVTSNLKVPQIQITTAASNGYVLTSDASGNGSWQAPSSSPWTVSGSNIYRFTGNVGIGTNQPTFRLHVIGNTYIDGSVRADKLLIPATEKYYSIPGCSFTSTSSTSYYSSRDINCIYINPDIAAGDADLVAPVHIPSGVSLEQISALVNDNGPAEITVSLYLITSDGGKFNLGSTNSSSNSSSPQNITGSLSSTVDNSNNAYVAVVRCYGTYSASEYYSLYKVKIKYSISSIP